MISSQVSILEHAVVLVAESYEHLVGVTASVNIPLHHVSLAPASVILVGIVYKAQEF